MHPQTPNVDSTAFFCLGRAKIPPRWAEENWSLSSSLRPVHVHGSGICCFDAHRDPFNISYSTSEPLESSHRGSCRHTSQCTHSTSCIGVYLYPIVTRPTGNIRVSLNRRIVRTVTVSKQVLEMFIVYNPSGVIDKISVVDRWCIKWGYTKLVQSWKAAQWKWRHPRSV